MGLRERFDAKVLRTDGCWSWLASKNNKGYGMLYAGRANGNKDPAHRVSWLLHYGPIPDGMRVLHRCDNPECTNPEHLFLGTQIDNMRDKERKHRGNHPSGYMGRRRLTSEQAAQARMLFANGMSKRALARYFGCDRDAVRIWL